MDKQPTTMDEADAYEDSLARYMKSLEEFDNEEEEAKKVKSSHFENEEENMEQDVDAEEISLTESQIEYNTMILEIMDIVREIVNDVETAVALKNVHEKISEERSQKLLFELRTIIPDFEIDAAVFDDMVFREDLVISKLKRKDLPPDMIEREEDMYITEPVGGLCLDIQRAEGKNPTNRFYRTEEEINKEISDKIDDIRDVLKQDPIEENKYESYLKNEVEKYENELRESMKCSNDKFLVHLSSQFDHNERAAGSRITAWVDKTLHTLEEKRTEYTYDEDHALLEKTLYTAIEKDCYTVKYKYQQEKILKVTKYSFKRTKDLILEGSNFVMMRLLALARYTGTFELSTLYIDGSICRNIYECLGPSTGIFNDTKLDICKIYRTIVESCGIVHKCCTVLTMHGQILKQDWEDCEYVLQVNPMCVLRNRKPTGYEEIVTKKAWEKDMELLSKYLDVQTETTLLIKAYLKDHPEVMDIISDYIQFILQMKPEKVIDFTIDYFQSYLPLNLPKIGLIEDEESFFRI